MFRTLLLGLSLLAVLTPWSNVGIAQTKITSDEQSPVLATVDGQNITQAEVEQFYQELPEQMKQIPLEQVQTQILDRLIDQRLVVNAAIKLGLNKIPAVKQKIDYEKVKILNEAYLEAILEKEVTPQKVRTAYNKSIALEQKKEEVKARHILLKTEEEAIQIIQKLKSGADFTKLAQVHSIGPSGKNGGDLGFFSADQMVPPFSRAAYALQKGQITETPVQTQFGWHVIKVDDRRLAGAQSFEEVAPQIREQLITKAYEKLLQDLRKGARIDRIGLGTSGFQRVQ